MITYRIIPSAHLNYQLVLHNYPYLTLYLLIYRGTRGAQTFQPPNPTVSQIFDSPTKDQEHGPQEGLKSCSKKSPRKRTLYVGTPEKPNE